MNRLIFGFVFILLIGFGMAANSEPSACCERTNDGAWCVNDVESACDDGYLSAPTSCDSTSYCRLGTCYESVEGICMENTPQQVCNNNGGTWDARDVEEVPQCQLGCCIIADQAAFVSLVRCKRLSTLFGVENNYKTDIFNEIDCIAEAQAQDVGACVYESDFERVCDFTTRGECNANEVVEVAGGGSQVAGGNLSLSSQKTFYEDFLCSAEELNTACARQTGTTCYQGDVYWTDSCGNKENVYSSDKARSWNSGRVAEADEVCAAGDGSDMNCGNCDYLLGSRCAEFEGIIGGPAGSDHYCQKTECVDRNGDERLNGESWCVAGSGTSGGGGYSGASLVGSGQDPAGSRYYKEVCVDGDVRVEPCADFRNEICLEDSINLGGRGSRVGGRDEFGSAACRVNRWQDCVLQIESDDCLNADQRDCMWLPSVTGMILGGSGGGSGGSGYSNPSGSNAFSNPTAGITGNFIFGGDDEEPIEKGVETNRPDGICVPNFPPGLEFWKGSGAQQICGQANAKCVVVTEKGLLGGSDIVEGEECLGEGWAMDANRICTSLGDCGGYVNYQGVYSDDGYKWDVDGSDQKFSPNSVNIVSGGFTGRVIGIVGGLFR